MAFSQKPCNLCFVVKQFEAKALFTYYIMNLWDYLEWEAKNIWLSVTRI